MRRKCDSKKVDIIHFDMNVFPRVAWILSYSLQLLFWNFNRKISVDKNLLYGKLPKYPNIYLLQCGQLYLALNFFAIFSKSDGAFHCNGTPICVFTNIMNNSAQLKDRELWMLVLFLLIILEICSLLTLKCAACVCFF